LRLLSVLLNGSEIAAVELGDLPCELTASRRIASESVIEFVDSASRHHDHSLAELSGWTHISIRVHENLACQADCIVTDSEVYQQDALMNGGAKGVRFQPFFLPGSTADEEALAGQGLFRRGLHFPGTVTPGSVRLSCECDYCRRTFHVQSFHAGFADVSYMYSESGAYTLLVDGRTPGRPPPTGKPNMEQLEKLEAALPLAPDRSTFGYMHPFRCPYCHRSYIDFEAHPELREGEYYGNCLFGVDPIRYEPAAAQ
jgi:hypothetical protein